MRSLLVAILALSAIGSTVYAQAPDSLGFQGYLTRTDGTPLDSASVSMTFNLYKSGSSVWSETQVVAVDSGNYNVYLGAATPLDTVAFNQAIDLGIKLDGEASEMSPRTPLVAGAWARALPGLYTFYRDEGSESGYNVVGGIPENSVASAVVGATISGGGVVLFGISARPNAITADRGTIGGGDKNTVNGGIGTVSGGSSNTVNGVAGVISGGSSNTVSDDYGSVCGGNQNTADYYSTVCGGDDNQATDTLSTVAGGLSNQATGGASTVAGGRLNIANAQYSTIGGGDSNDATGPRSTIGGGEDNVASGDFATVPGGTWNTAGGYSSFATGQWAKANHNGTFVWQDSSGSFHALASTASNQFLARASGGFFFYTGAAPNLTMGIGLPAGSGTWTALSSKASKTDFNDVDALSYLDRVASLDLKEWSYKTEAGVTHVGPMAEDFYAAFGHGPTEKGISGVDGDGVALAAIQGLYELVQELQAENAQMRAAMARAGIE